MNLKIKSFLLPLTILLVLGIQQTKAQEVVVKNGVEYIEKKSSDNLNTIKAPSKKTKLNKKKLLKLKKSIVTINDLEKIIEKRKRLRYRNRRNISIAEKCYKETQDTCHADEKK